MKRTSRMRRLLAGLRQRVFPPEYRIVEPGWSPDLRLALEQLLLDFKPGDSAEPREEKKPALHAGNGDPHGELLLFVVNLLSNVGTGLWRLRNKMVRPGTDEPLEEMRRAYRHLQSTWDVLKEAGVEILDHNGEAVPEGGVYSLKTLAYQPTPGINRERVIETIKPTIYFKDQMIQMGEVIIGTPESPDARGRSGVAT
jgi:hypothetical protein